MIPWLDTFVAECAARLQALPPTDPARQYLVTRSVSEAAQQDYAVGWLDYPAATRATPTFWAWLQKYGRACFVFPLRDPFGRVTGVVLRSLANKAYYNNIVYPKELCPPCFGLDIALPEMYTTERVVLVEGIFDYFAVRPFTPAVLAQLTSTPSRILQRFLARYVTKVVVLADMDKAGRRAAYRLAGFSPPPEYQDPHATKLPIFKPAPFHVLVPAYSAHDPSELAACGRVDELQRLVNL